MAIKLDTRYPGRAGAASLDYPQGSFKNRSAPGVIDGTPLEKDWANDLAAFLQSLIKAAGITPNDLVDKVGASQYFTALKSISTTPVWSNLINYTLPAMVFGSNDKPYIALQASGPSTAPQNPISSPLYWKLYDATPLYIGTAGGTANAITAAFSPAPTSYASISGVPIYVRSASVSTTTTPTININGLGAKSIVKGANAALSVADIAGAGYWLILQYDSTLDKFVLANPAKGITPPIGVGQTWQNLTASRAVATTYTNSTGREIQIFICADYATATTTLNGVAFNTSDANGLHYIFAVIPDGGTYRIDGSAGTGLQSWGELR